MSAATGFAITLALACSPSFGLVSTSPMRSESACTLTFRGPPPPPSSAVFTTTLPPGLKDLSMGMTVWAVCRGTWFVSMRSWKRDVSPAFLTSPAPLAFMAPRSMSRVLISMIPGFFDTLVLRVHGPLAGLSRKVPKVMAMGFMSASALRSKASLVPDVTSLIPAGPVIFMAAGMNPARRGMPAGVMRSD